MVSAPSLQNVCFKFSTTHGVVFFLTRGFEEFNFGGIETEMNLD